MSTVDPEVRCPKCGYRSTAGATADLKRCPSCGTHATMEFVALDVTGPINWDALRLLATWAEEHSKSFPPESRAHIELDVLLTNLRKLRPEGGLPLTLSEEVSEAVATVKRSRS